MKNKTNTQLDHSRPLDVHKWSDYPEVNSFVNQVWEDFLATEFPAQTGREKRPKGPKKQQFKVLPLDLYVAWREDPDLLIGVSLRKGSYKAGSRYNSLYISEAIVDVILHLEEVGLLDYKGTESAKINTHMARSLEAFELNLNLLTINPHKDKEVIVLNDTDSKAIEYNDGDYMKFHVCARRCKVQRALRKNFIDIGDLENLSTEQWFGTDKRVK